MMKSIEDRIQALTQCEQFDVKDAKLHVVQIPPEKGNQHLLICLESTLEKLNFITIIPELCSRIVTRADHQMERILGPECVDAIFQLFSAQMAWVMSNNNSTMNQTHFRKNGQLSCDTKNRHFPTIHLINASAEQVGPNMENNNMILTMAAIKSDKEGAQPKFKMNEQRQGIQINSFEITSWDQPTSHSDSENHEIFTSDSESTSTPTPSCETSWPDAQPESGSLVIQSENVQGTKFSKGHLQLASHDGHSKEMDSSITFMPMLSDIKNLYKKLLHQLQENQLFQDWMARKKGNHLKSDESEKNGLKILNPKTNSNMFQASNGVYVFRSQMSKLHQLMKERLICPYEDSIQKFHSTKEFWIRDKYYNKQAVKLTKILTTMKTDRTGMLQTYDVEIQDLKLECQKTVGEGYEQLREIVKKYEIGNLLNKKTEKIRQTQIQSVLDEMKLAQINFEKLHTVEGLALKQKKKLIENKLTAIISKYDENLCSRQALYDKLVSQEKENTLKISSLTKMVQDTQEMFEEMRDTKKLKEILRNIAMADDFLENRAARIIQMAWRRYKVRKHRKKKRKGRFKRKPKPKEILYYQWCTPQDHVRGIRKHSGPCEKPHAAILAQKRTSIVQQSKKKVQMKRN